jgi:acetylornithine/succinyldiaminopimelate/putrescine aminotransferase/predicted amino acid dehydrogenase/acyl-CoA synthetase (AMP-forming)/AMP-acid ligase II
MPPLLHGAPLPADSILATIPALLSEDDRPFIVGYARGHDLSISPRQLTHAAVCAQRLAAAHDIQPGDAVILLSPPWAEEPLTAALLLALLAAGLRTVAPLFDTPGLLQLALQHAHPKALIADLHLADAAQRAAMRDLAAKLNLPLLALDDLLCLDPPQNPARLTERACLDDILWLSTSGSSGAPRLVRHHERALLAALASQQAAGLLDPQRGFGHTLIPMIAHTMSLRALLGALRSGHKALFIPPAWLDARPFDVIRLCEAHPPTHITAAPALIHTILRYLAAFPRMAERVLPHLTSITSSGAPFDPALVPLVPPSIKLYNALGTSETHQLTHSALAQHDDPTHLGAPLPGVSLALHNAGDGLYHLFASTPAAAAGYAGEQPFDAWIDTGDLVRWDGARLTFVARSSALDHCDLDSNGLGLRLPIAFLEHDLTDWLRCPTALFAPPDHDGLVALVYGADPRDLPEQLAAWHEQRLTPWPARISAAALLPAPPQLNAAGKIDRTRLLASYQAVKDHLIPVPHPPLASPLASRHQLPRRAQLMAALHLDWEVLQGQQDTLTMRRAGLQRDVLDLVGGFGSNLLGHNYPDLVQTAQDALAAVPILDQGADRPHAAALCAALSARLGRETRRRYIVALSSTGAEAVELALKHAMFALRTRIDAHHTLLRQRHGADHPDATRSHIAANEHLLRAHKPLLLSIQRGYHGKTLGALLASGDDAQRKPLDALLGADVLRLPPQPTDEARALLKDALASHTLQLHGLTLPYVVAILAEPLQAEGGVRAVDLDWLAELRALTGAPLIMDEIQSGMGRCGAFIASQPIRADYYLLGKALGGGVAKIAATLIDHALYLPAFDDLRGATFSADALSCKVALKALALHDALDIPARTQALGQRLGQALLALATRHPHTLRVSGQGALWGVSLAIPQGKSTMLDALATRGLGYLAASYLLNVHRLRLLPTLSAPDTLRIEPSVWLTDAQIDHLCSGLDALACALDDANLFELTAHLVAPEDALASLRPMAALYARQDPASRPFQIVRQPAPQGARRVAFIHNAVQPNKLLLADSPPMALLTSSQRLDLIARFELLMELGPMPSFTRAFFDGKVWMYGITMAATPQTLDHLKRTGDLALARQQLQRALDLAAQAGCEVAIFGAHTSIISDSASTLHPPPGVQISSGNSYTTAALLDRVERLAALDAAPVAILGATGNIGNALAELLAATPSPHPLTLLGRPGAEDRLHALAARLDAQRPLIISCDLDDLRRSDIILCAISSPEPAVHPQHIASDRPILIADVSQPAALHPTVAALPNVTVVHAGYVRLPRDPDFVMSAHTGPGESFACAAEGLLLGLEPQPDLVLHGPLRGATIARLRALGRRWGLSTD